MLFCRKSYINGQNKKILQVNFVQQKILLIWIKKKQDNEIVSKLFDNIFNN